MADTTFIDQNQNTPIVAAWLNDVNATVYRALGVGGIAPITAQQVVTNLGLIPYQGAMLASTDEGPFVAGVNFTAGVTTSLPLTQSYGTVSKLDVHFDGVYQGYDQFSLSGTNIIFNNPIPLGVTTVYIKGYYPVPPSGGTVTSVAVNAGNGFTGVVSSPNTAAAIALGTSVVGMMKGAGGAAVAAVSGTDYTPGTFLQTGANAVGRTFTSKEQDFVNASDYGIVADGITDVTTKINLLLAEHTNRIIKFNTGTYFISGTLNLAGSQHLVGEGSINTTFLASGSGFDVINMSTFGCTVEGIGFNCNAQRTSGSYINVTGGGDQIINDFRMLNAYIGITTGSMAVLHISRGEIRNICPATGSGFYVVGTTDIHIHDVTIDNPAASQPFAGIQIFAAGGIWMDGCDFIHCHIGLLILPASGAQSVDWGFFSNCSFDTSSNYGIYIAPSGGGSVKGMTFTGCWTSTCVGGILLLPDATSTIDGVDFNGHRSFNNNQRGMLYSGGTNIHLNACIFTGNSQSSSGTYAGIDILPNNIAFSVTNCYLAQGYGFANTQSYGLQIGTGCNNYIISNNDMRLNVQGAMNNLSDVTATTYYESGNLGVAQSSAGVTSFNARSGSITLISTDVSSAGGALLTGASFSGAVDTAATMRATNFTTPASGAGLEVLYKPGAGDGFISSYDRTGAAWKQLTIGASVVYVSTNGTNAAIFDNLQQMYIGYATSQGAYRLQVNGSIWGVTETTAVNDQRMASTAFVHSVLAAGSVTSFNSRTGAITLAAADVTGVNGAITTNANNWTQYQDMQVGSRASGNFTPIAGAGIEFVFKSGAGDGFISSYDRGGSVWKQLTLGCSNFFIGTSGTNAMVIDAAQQMYIGYATSQGSFKLQVNSQIFATNATIATPSDRRLKTNFKPLGCVTDIVVKLGRKVQTFNYLPLSQMNFPTSTQLGWAAQDVADILAQEPYRENVTSIGDSGFMNLSPSAMLPLLFKTIAEMSDRIAELERKLS